MINSFVSDLRSLGAGAGDAIYFCSDVSRFLCEARTREGVNDARARDEFLHRFIDALQALVGEGGTLLFPIFSWDFCRGRAFDARSSLGSTGALPNWILTNREDFVRTAHPIYSFLVWGADARTLAVMNNADCFGRYSPFGYMHRKCAKVVFFGVSVQRSFTFCHYVETALQVPYRYYKDFRALYTDASGETSERRYAMFVRDLAIKSQEYMPDEFFANAGILKRANDAKIMDCADAYELIARDLRQNGGRNIYKFENYEIDWSSGHTHDDDLGN